ncbi:MAG: superoxide dismutase, Ni [Dehalococcoidia bacterium]|nr:superoxide dismutase, Ni [Dehalococcoidia bacterium]
MRSVISLARWLPARKAHAHCDVPCGIYDPIGAKIAAQTVQKMVQRIQALPAPGASDAPQARHDRENKLARYTQVKEEHAGVCKKELDILWHDYFKPEHLQKYADLHEVFWNATKLCSKNKQEVNMDAAKQLVAAVDKVAEMFWATKGQTWKDTMADVRYGS